MVEKYKQISGLLGISIGVALATMNGILEEVIVFFVERLGFDT